MDANLLLQPFGAQGGNSALGLVLLHELSSRRFREFHVTVAFATSSGTSRLCGGVRDLVQAGGTAQFVCGIGNGVTSRQAVDHLLQAGAAVTGVALAGRNLFHQKVYRLVGAQQALLIVGSNNLTLDGLFRHFEACTILRLDPMAARERAILDEPVRLIERLRREFPANFLDLSPGSLDGLVQEGLLIDERVRPPRATAEVDESDELERGGEAASTPPRRVPTITIPAPPAAAPGFAPTRRPAPAGQTRALEPATETTVATVAITPAPATPQLTSFAMVLAQFDVSHRRGVPGTPEMSLPGDVEDFFGPLGHDNKNRKHAGRHFLVQLDRPIGSLNQEFRAWRREAGEGGNADFRLRVTHELIDLTDPNGGDVLYVQRRRGANPEYLVRIVKPQDAEFGAVSARCTRTGGTGGAAGQKRYGLWTA